ncbi:MULTISPECIES: NUDIX hydrolase [Prauserella salsuginis group]|uniref:NUDIX domain-containing protein n=1 Tax=Prauserella salsuginis TaxID=387889 RepID=A0ABW6G906_9PSEU|nr:MULTISPECIES: NUDIX hydrolase [Prauserella salsuginis group]MCR3719399.1 8-oxo-dGTP diphosphatase [Prauserella flava]MCR3735587.1 8-oxo-dGTP diphosphatase [Prauserella salsuginis]
MSTTTEAADHIAAHAAGAVLWRPAADGAPGVEIAVVHRPRYDDWSLPKGHLDPGETAPVAAVRELREETGFPAVLGAFLKRVEYRIARGRKAVDYFSARAGEGVFEANGEVDELRWAAPDDAAQLLTYDSDSDVVERFAALPQQVTSMLLVRHAKAGKRETWTGDDDLRPLSDAGERQARALQPILATFAPDRVLSAPLLRCVQTVKGVAEDLGTEVAHDDALSERNFAADPGRAVQRIVEIAVEGGTPVVCSQGGVIPHVVATLADRGGVALPRTKPDGVAAKKGSVWQLTFDRVGRLVAAGYLSNALAAPLAV